MEGWSTVTVSPRWTEPVVYESTTIDPMASALPLLMNSATAIVASAASRVSDSRERCAKCMATSMAYVSIAVEETLDYAFSRSSAMSLVGSGYRWLRLA